jgi:hypothetical protein
MTCPGRPEASSVYSGANSYNWSWDLENWIGSMLSQCCQDSVEEAFLVFRGLTA